MYAGQIFALNEEEIKMKTGLNFIVITMVLSFSVSNVFAYKPSQFDKLSLKQNCQRELESPFKDMAGTPSCDKLRKIEIDENQPTRRVILENE